MTIMAQVLENHESDDNPMTSEEENEDDDGGFTNAGWADSIAKILKTNKPKGKKSLVLSKAKKLTEVKKTKIKSAGFEVETVEGEVKEEKIEEEEEKKEEILRKKKKEFPSLRIKPNVLQKDKERLLTKIATRGVVQLFNAVKMQQKDISKKLDEAGPLEVRKEKALKSIDKRAFLDVLMGGKSGTEDSLKEKEVNKGESTWSVLRDDFMMGAKMKDWDKEIDQEMEDEQETQIEMESD